jgi:hypothetical protein
MPKEIKVSPQGELMWAKVLAPGIANKGKEGEKEQWSVDLLLSKDDAGAQAFVKSLKEAFIEAHGSGSRPGPNGLPYKTFLDQSGDETSLWQISFKRNVRTMRGMDLPPPAVQDAKGTPWPQDVLIGNGSTGKVAFSPWSWNVPEGGKGISLNLEAVRVLHLVEYSPPDMGAVFGAPEKGYVLTGDEKRSPKEAAAKEEAGPIWGDTEEIPF